MNKIYVPFKFKFYNYHGAYWIAAFIDDARYLTFFSFIPAIEILPLFNKYMWYLFIRISHCFVLNPVYENIPIWSVMWFQVPGVFMASSYFLRASLISMILLATELQSSSSHYLYSEGELRISETSLAPWRGGLEYFFLMMILKYRDSYLS